MYITINDNFINFDLNIFEENEYEKWNIAFEMLAETLEIKDYIGNKIEICNFDTEDEVVRLIKYFVFNNTYSIKNFKGNVITITYKPYMQSNDFEIICSSRVFDIIMKKIKNI